MADQIKRINCTQCDGEFRGNFCSTCGNPKSLRRIDGAYIISEVASIFNFEKGILLTIRELLLRPGRNIQAFILEDRNRLVKPIVFIILCSLIYTLFQQIFKFEDGYVNYSFEESSSSLYMFEWVTKNYGYANILISLFIVAWIKAFFRKDSYNFFEILILLCFVIGMGMLIFTFFGVIDSLTGLNIIDKGFFIGVLYISWSIGQFFSGNKVKNSLKGLMSYMLGLFSFALFILILGSLIDWVMGFPFASQ
ncbi:MAG: DUF3667 domain-containing protein [Bacteroidota bacterium]